MLKNLFEGLVSIFIVLSCAFLITGDVTRFVYWVKCCKIDKRIGIHYYFGFWDNERGTECTNEEIKELHQMIRQFEEKHSEI
ncbi:MAG: hypothetical protein NC420_11020 [Eubacterium sp.]|nr:hypothetical protein [Eubacterium sp.]MCM1213074.1 hypothetical protein [Lachnospiraceae bacterium]MCM1240753.1 hypothetical protein [Lachnospiraceae bacterium]MCM1240832.1 hypothetical protein [Lachnospiraceae bacterium]